MDRKTAFTSGIKTFDAAKPCSRGHWPTKRYTSGGACVACMTARYKRMQHPLANVVYVPPELQQTFDTLIAALGLRTEARPGAPIDAAPLTYDTQTPGVPSTTLQATHAEVLDTPEQRAYDARRSQLLSVPLQGRQLFEGLASEREALDKVRESVAAKHGVAIEELLHTFI